MAVFKATENKKNSNAGTFKATNRKSYDDQSVYEWESTNKNAIETLNNYNTRLSNNEWMSSDDISAYRKAMDDYIDSSNRLRTLGKSFGTSYSEEEEKEWNDYITSMNSNYDNVSKFYSNFSSADEYDSWYKKESFIDAYLKNAEKAKTEFEYNNAWVKEADLRKQTEEVKTYEDFDYYSQIGADIENPSYNKANGWVNIGDWHPFGQEVGNIVTFSKDNYDSILMDGKGAVGNSKYYFMTDDEVKIYNYYLGKGDKASAEKYLQALDDTLTQREGGRLAENIQNANLEWLMAINVGLDQYASGVRNIDNFILGKEADPITAIQYAGAEIREDIESDFWRGAWDLGVTVSNQLPSILVGSLTGSIGGLATMGASVVGNSYAEMRNLGYNEWQSRGYAALVTAAELGLQSVLGGISSLGGSKSLSRMAASALDSVDNAIARVALKLGASMISEGIEEATQSVLEPIFKSIFTGKFEGIDWGEVAYSGLLGALSAGLLESVGTVATDVKTSNAGQVVKNVGAVDRLSKLGSTFSADSVAYKLAGKVNENTGAYTVGRLLNEVGATLTEQNTSEIVKSLTRKGMSEKDAQINAKWLAKVVEGEALTDQQIEIIENNDVVSKTFYDVIVNSNSTANQRMQGYDETMRMAMGDTVMNAKTAQNGTNVSQMGVSSVEGKATKISGEGDATGGKTTYDGEDVSIKGISYIKDGVVTVSLEDGREVNARDVDFSNESEGLVYEAVANMTPETANDLIEGFNQGNLGDGNSISLENYLRGFNEAYRYGSIGMPVTEMSRNGFSADLTEQQKKIAYNRGKTDAMTKVKANQAKVDEKKSTISKTEKVEKEGKVTYLDGAKPTGARQKSAVKAIEVLSESIGNNWYVFSSYVENGKRVYKDKDGKVKPAPNGKYDTATGDIYIDLNAGQSGEGLMVFTMAHELTHFIRQWSPAKFKVFADFLLEQYGEMGVPVEQMIQRKIANAKANGRELSYDNAYEEVIADSCESMLRDSNAIEAIAKLKAKDKSVWEKIKSFISKLVAKLRAAYAKFDPQSVEGRMVLKMKESAEKLQSMWTDALVDAGEAYQTIGSRNLSDFTEAKNAEGGQLFQYRAMEADKDIYRAMLLKHGLMTEKEINNLFNTIDKAVDVIKNNLEALDYAWDVDIDDRAFMPVKPNSDKLYAVSLDFSTLCRKRLLQQTIQATLQEALNKPLSKEEGIAIRDELMKIQEEGRQIEIACALCYVESARMKSPTQIKKFLKNRESVLIDFFAGRAGGSTSEKIKQAEADARAKFHKENPNGIRGKNGIIVDPLTSPLSKMLDRDAEQIRKAKKAAKLAYKPTPNEQKMIDAVKGMKTSDFTSPEGLENLAKNYSDIFDAYTSFVRNATHSKGIEKDTWWRAGDSEGLIGQALIDRMNAENGLRSQSWSDFQVIHLLDYIAATIELSTKNAKRQSYTKVSDYVRLLGNTGDMINMSLIPMAKYNGKLEYDSVEGMAYKIALELREKYHATAGTICIGIDNAQIKQLLADGTIDYVIPYHKSSMSQATKKLMHIPSWFDYEPYQSESALSSADAKENAKKYGVELLSKSDKNYNKSTKFSEWFDLKEAQQIAKMENVNPSDPAMQKKYGVMYGAYKAMQNAANNYLKLCAERGLSPKFSHENADFTSEENYWKLLIDRKMVDNVTGEIIEQKAIKPIFDEAEVLGILNRELERYPQVKKDQEYATRKVVGKFLSGEMKIDKDTREAIKKTVDNVTAVNIEASSETLLSDRDASWRDVDTIQGLEGYSVEEVTDIVRQHIENIAMEYGEDIEIVGIRPYGSRARGTAKKRSDLDVVLQYEGDIREDDMFNMLNDGDEKLTIDGIEVDINPIKADDTGTIEEYLDRVYSYDKYSDTKFSDRDSAGNQLTEEQQEFFKDSKVRDSKGRLQVVYHGTTSEFNTFKRGDIGYHFGSYAQARNRLSYQGGKKRYIKAYLDIKNPLVIEHDSGSWHGNYAAGMLLTWGDFNGNPEYVEKLQEIARMYDTRKSDVELKNFLKSLGYDGVQYLNTHESDFGKESYSYIAFDSNQVKEVTNLKPTADPDIRYSDRVTDKETLDFLENQEHVTVYRAMQLIDGKLYPPMNAYTYDENGEKVLMPPSEIGAWEQAVERPDLIDPKTGKFKLDKGKVDSGKRGTPVSAAYNPYIHTSLSMLNDQFTSAYTRSNLVVVKGVVPKSELTSGYHAQHAKDSVGETEWHSGVVSTQLPESRKVILSRWFKPVEVMDSDVVAENIKKMLGNTGIEIPYNVVSPKLRRSLEKIGVPIGEGRGIKNLPSKNEVKYSDRDLAPTFYSQMGKVVEGMKQEKFAANSVIPMLRGRGIKAEEIRWSGVATWLEGKKSVTKQEVLEFIRGSQLQIGEQMSGTSTFIADDGSEYESETAFKNAAYAIADEKGIPRDSVRFNIDTNRDMYAYAFALGTNEALLQADVEESDGMSPRWSQYKLDGGTNYREIVFTMPNSSYSNRAMRGHWGQDAEGVLVHARIQDFDVNGKKMLFIEELQSDWHNEGHSKGYLTKEYEAAVESQDKLYNEYEKMNLAFHKYIRSNDFMTDPEDARKKKHDWLRGKAETAQKKYYDAVNVVESLKEKGAGDTPDAPFKDTYHEYVLKRLLRMAAEQGYDSIGWTPAYMQEERWSEDYAEGYRIEYDQDMPKFLKKYGRQWGATVGKTAIEVAEHFVNGVRYDAEKVDVWSMDITDSMKDSVLHEGQVLYSDRDFASQVEAVLSGADTNSTHLKLFDTTPNLLQEVGLPDLPILMAASHMKDSVRGKHGLPIDIVKNLPKYISEPVMIADSLTRDDSVVIITEAIDSENRPVIAAIKLSGGGRINGKHIDANVVLSVYGKDNFQSFLNRIAENNAVIYWNKKKSQDLSVSLGVQFSNAITSLNSDTIIRKAKAFVKGNSKISENSQKLSDRDPDSVSNRSLLANALETAVQNDIERNKLQQYKEKIDLINSEEAKLHKLNTQIREALFTKGQRDSKKIRDLQFEKKQTENRINTYDRQLLTLEASKPLKDVLEREKRLAYEKAEKEGVKALLAYREKAAKTTRELMTRYQESRAKATESRNKTEYRHKIKKVVGDLNQLLLRPTKDKHIKEELRTAVAEALSAINMDTIGAEERVAKYNALIAKTSDPDMIAELTATRDRIELQGEALKDKLTALQTAYEKIKNSTDPELKNAYQEPVMNAIKNVVDTVGNTSLRDMTLTQLEAVYEMYKMVLHTVRTANKAFKAKKGETITQISEAVNDEIRKVGKEKFKRNPLAAWLRKTGWTLLKPFTAFRTIGSDTFTGLYKELRNGEDVFYVDINEAKSFIQEKYKKYNFKSWDQKQTKTFTAKSGKTFTLTLEQMMSLYAYSRRTQAHDHIIEGGIVLEDSVIETKKLGLPVKYKVDTKSAFNISDETLQEICDSLTADQIGFVDEMQAYLSDVMGTKGNEVSMELLGVKLFKEKYYFPLKSSKYYMGFKPEEAGEIKLKNPAFSKETVQHANNPVVLKGFTDVWATHINDMSMYHAFVLPLEDFTRVYNYKTKTDANLETMSTEATIANAFGEGATQYIRNFLKSLNGGVRTESVGLADKAVSLSKKGAVLASASVMIQQPSAIMRAMALINPIHFATSTHKSINLVKHGKDWAELKQYAPIAGIKEMGRFDVGMGQSTVKWIKDQNTIMENADEILSKAPAFMDEVTWVGIWNAVKNEVKHNNKDLAVGSEEYLKKCGERFTEVISLTQVYDSVFSRSDIMRNQSWIAKALTAFMAEPSTTLNMFVDSWIQGKRTGKFGGFVKTTAGTTGAIVGSIVLNAALKSIITAMRDDDDEEAYVEKYLGAFVGNVKDDLNPLSYIPFVKDIVSIFKGYDVERMDMALFSDLKNAIDAMDSESKTEYEKWTGLIGAISAFVGVPFKNVERDIRGAYNTIKSFSTGEKATRAGMWNAIEEGLTGKEKSNTKQLYEAYLSDDKEQIKRVEGRFEEKSEIEAALRKALRDNDSRIREAAQAVVDGNHAERIRLTREIVAEGHFKQDIVVGAINAELTALRKELKEENNKS